MASESDNLQTSIDNVTAKLAEVTANPKPTYSIDGQSVSWGEYYKSLVDLRNALKAAKVDADGPYEFHVQGYS